MSGYSDEPRDSDDRDDDRDERGGPDRDERDVRTAKSRVMVPAIGLIAIAGFGLLSILINLVQFPTLDAQFDAEVKKIEDNNQFTDAQKKDQIQIINQIRDVMKVGLLPYLAVLGLTSLITLLAGIKLMSLSSPGLVTFGAILSLLPCLSGCCVLGLVFGIWAMVAMSKPEVKAGFAAKRRLAAGDSY